jgi:hypothetical protein
MCAGGTAVDAAPLPTSDGWERPLSVWQRFVTLPEFLEEAGKVTQAPLRASPLMRDRKLMAFFRDRPAYEALSAAADALAAEWTLEDGVWTLRPDPARLSLERTAVPVGPRRAAEAELRRWQRAANADFLVLRTRLRELEAEAKRLAAERPEGWEDRLTNLGRSIEDAAIAGQDPLKYIAAVVTRGLTAREWQGFMGGQPLVLGEFDGARPVPERAALWLASEEAEAPPEGVRSIVLGMEPGAYRLQMRAFGANGSSWSSTAELTQPDLAGPHLAQIDAEDGTWSGTGDDPPVRRLDPKAPPILAVGWKWTLSEICASWALRSGLPLIGEALRTPRPTPVSLYAVDSAEAWVEEAGRVLGDGFRWSGGWLRVRPRHAFLHRGSEPPEAIVRKLEAQEFPSLDLYGELAAGCSTMAETRFALGRVSGAFDPRPLVTAIPALRFWHSLGPDHRRRALEREPLLFAAMTRAQQDLFMAALARGLYEPGASPEFVEAFPAMASPEGRGDLAFYMEPFTTVRQIATSGTQTIEAGPTDDLERTIGNIRDPRVWRVTTVRQREFRFFLGLDAQRSAQFSAKLDEAL